MYYHAKKICCNLLPYMYICAFWRAVVFFRKDSAKFMKCVKPLCHLQINTQMNVKSRASALTTPFTRSMSWVLQMGCLILEKVTSTSDYL